MTETTLPTNRVPARKPQEVDAIAEWRSTLTGLTGALLLFLSLTGFSICTPSAPVGQNSLIV